MSIYSRIISSQRPPVKKQGRLMRRNYRENVYNGAQWGNWLDLPFLIPTSASDEPSDDEVDDTPTSSWTKAEIVAWLNVNGDPAQDSLTKAELLDHVNAILSP